MEFIDIHSHILPELDDGAANIEESVSLALSSLQNGVTRIIATPHFKTTYPSITHDSINKKVTELNYRLKKDDIPVKIYPGAEIFITPDIPEIADNGNLICLASSKFILLELPFNEIPLYLSSVIFDLKLRSITPVLAHVERNSEIQRNIFLLEPLINQGAITQVNSTSFTGIMGIEAKRCAFELLKKDFIGVIASDSHSWGERFPNFVEVIQILENHCGKLKAEQLFSEVPGKILSL